MVIHVVVVLAVVEVFAVVVDTVHSSREGADLGAPTEEQVALRLR